MKKIYLTCLCLFMILMAKSQSDFVVGESEGTLFIEHQLQEHETLQSLSQYYLVRPGAIQKLNGLEMNQWPTVKEFIRIPLSETNFIKVRPADASANIHALHFMLGSSDNLKSLSELLFISQETLKKLNPESQFRRGELVLIGWMHTSGLPQKNVSVPSREDSRSVPSAASANTQPARRKQAPLAKPVLVKNDPNRTVRRVRTPKEKGSKKSFRQLWDELVNGKPKNPVSSVASSQNPPRVNRPVKDTSGKAESAKRTENSVSAATPVKPKQEGTATLPNNPESTNSPTANKPKKSFKERWDLLVNGKPKPVEKRSQSPTPKPNQNRESNNSNTSLNSKDKPANQPEVDTHASRKPKKTLKERWNTLVNGNRQTVSEPAVNQPKTEPIKTTKPAITKSTPAVSDTTTSVKKKKTLQERWNHLVNGPEKKTTVTSMPAKKTTPKIVKTPEQKTPQSVGKGTTQKPKETTVTTSSPDTLVNTTDPFADAAKVVRSETQVLNGEGRNLEFKQTENGKAAWFFSGPIGGKFYVVTNLVAKGQLVKVVNTQNGKSVIAEVIGNLPGNDLTKGLILKLSDNAKLPLGQKNPVFSVKIMY